eukprot:5376810-Alexandrium_andersonii.AAC.1
MSETKSLSPRWSALHLRGPVWARLLTPGVRVEEGFTHVRLSGQRLVQHSIYDSCDFTLREAVLSQFTFERSPH